MSGLAVILYAGYQIDPKALEAGLRVTAEMRFELVLLRDPDGSLNAKVPAGGAGDRCAGG